MPARLLSLDISHLPALAMRHIADLHLDEQNQRPRNVYVIADAARIMLHILCQVAATTRPCRA